MTTMRMSLREWQRTLKPAAELIVQASRKDGSDAWQPFPIGMGWRYHDACHDATVDAADDADAATRLAAFQIGDHDSPLLLAIAPHTDSRRRGAADAAAVNRRTIVAELAPRYENQELDGAAYFAALPRYRFVASPEGNGVDCHRHYEALIAGCIPVLERNPLAEAKYWGCPVLWTTDFREIDDAYLGCKYQEMLDAEYDFSKLLKSSYPLAQVADMEDCREYWIQKLSVSVGSGTGRP